MADWCNCKNDVVYCWEMTSAVHGIFSSHTTSVAPVAVILGAFCMIITFIFQSKSRLQNC